MSLPISSSIGLFTVAVTLSATAGFGVYFLGSQTSAPVAGPASAPVLEQLRDALESARDAPILTQNEPVFVAEASQNGAYAKWFALPNLFTTVQSGEDGAAEARGGFLVAFETDDETDFYRVEYAIPAADCVLSSMNPAAEVGVYESIDDGEWEYSGSAIPNADSRTVRDLLAAVVCEVHFRTLSSQSR